MTDPPTENVAPVAPINIDEITDEEIIRILNYLLDKLISSGRIERLLPMLINIVNSKIFTIKEHSKDGKSN
jgi:hypothetical protein